MTPGAVPKDDPHALGLGDLSRGKEKVAVLAVENTVRVRVRSVKTSLAPQ